MNIVIAGVGSGIGFELAKRYAKKASNLYLLSRNTESMERLFDYAQKLGVNTIYYKVDVTKFETVQSIANEICDMERKIDIVIFNAGISAGHSCEIQKFEDFRTIIDTNFTSIHALFEPFIKKMITQQNGKLVLISSLASFVAMPTTLAYSASKRAINSYADSLRLSLLKHGIKVVNIQPGFIKTPMTDKNNFKMPFLMKLEDGVDEIEKAIDKSYKNYSFPFLFSSFVRFLAILPEFVREFLILKLSNLAYEKK